MRGRVLIIAGSDPSGGAGIQADIKTVTALGGYAMTAITAITVQDTKGVYNVMPVPINIIREQIKVCIHDIGVDAIKIGMMGDKDTAYMISGLVYEEARNIPIVLDPVMVSTSGDTLAKVGVKQVIYNEFLRYGNVIATPNIPELEELSGVKINSVDDMMRAGRELSSWSLARLLLKGGHLDGDQVTDIFFRGSSVYTYRNPRLNSTSTHGTGCTLSSAIAAGCAQGLTIHKSIERAIDYVRKAIETAPGFGKGHGPLNHGHVISVLNESNEND